MSLVKNEDYIHIAGWMVEELGLKGNELLIYAMVHGFSRAENHTFKGSLQYIADWTNSTKRGVMNNLKSLVEKGLLCKEEKIFNGVKRCEYYVTDFRGGEKSSGVVKKVLPTDEKSSPNILEDILDIPSPSSAISSVDTTDIATEEEENPSKNLSKKSSPSIKTLKDDFEEIWKLYPNKQGKKKAFAAYERAIRDGVENAEILDGVKRYAKYCQDRRDEKRYIKHGDTWFNGACWQDEYDDTPTRPRSAYGQGMNLNDNIRASDEKLRAEGIINEYGEAPF